MSYSINRTFHLKLTTVTPVSIGGDQGLKLSPYSDYIFDDNGDSIRYVKTALIEKRIRDILAKDKKSNILDKYVSGVAQMENNRYPFVLKDFIKNDLGLDIIHTTYPSISLIGFEDDKKREIAVIVKNNQQPYIPGSSLKGAIRTAILYNWIVAENKFEIPWEDDLFGKIQDGPQSRFIKVTDSSLASVEDLVILGTERIRIKTSQKENNSPIPSPREAIAINTELTFSLKIEKPPKSKNDPIVHQELQYWNKETDILKKINLFSKACINFELHTLHDRRAFHPKFEEQIKDLTHFYENLKHRIENGEFFLRLGSGKVQYDNSLLLAIYKNDSSPEKKTFRSYRKKAWGIPENQEIYPATRLIINGINKPLGWVKLQPLN